MNQKAIIIGSGLTGSFLASILGKYGLEIDIYEKRNFFSKQFADSQRTIGMSISNRGLSALTRLGIQKSIIKYATPTYGRLTHDFFGKKSMQYYSEDNHSILTVDRTLLNETLLKKLEHHKNVNIFFHSVLESINFLEKKICVNINGVSQEKKYDYLFGTDGVFSTCRTIYEQFLRISPQIQQLPIGYKEFRIPFSNCSGTILHKNLINIWTSNKSDAIFVALPSHKNEAFLINIFCPNEWINFFQSNPKKNQIIKHLIQYFPTLYSILQNIDEKYFTGKTSKMYQINSNHWNYKDSFLLLGDSAHAIAPFYAMGINLCFESCAIFDDLIDDTEDISKAISVFQENRKRDTDAMQDLAYENFFNIAGSSSTHSTNIWNVERELYRLLPKIWIPEYHLISFTNIPLSKVKSRISKQRFIIKELVDPDSGILKSEYSSEENINNHLKKLGLLIKA